MIEKDEGSVYEILGEKSARVMLALLCDGIFHGDTGRRLALALPHSFGPVTPQLQ
jgi:hypothetical protein